MRMKRLLCLLGALLLCLSLCPITQAQEGNIVIFEGAKSAKGKDAVLDFIFTKHAGGTFDPRIMTKGSLLAAEYYCQDENGLYLALLSHSGGTRWATLQPTSITPLGDNRWRAEFSFIAISMRINRLFHLLDEIRPLCSSDKSVILQKLEYIEGDGIPLSYPENVWYVPTEGIAFLGDSITQNVFYNEGDFNILLKRKDCVNYGIGAQTTVHMLNRVDVIAGRNHKQLVLWCGINDLGSSFPGAIMDRVSAMIDLVRSQNSGIRFTIISVLPTTDAFFKGQQHKIVQLNDLYRAYADTHTDTDFCDIYPYFVADNGYCKPELMLDGLHPNHEGYQILAEHLPAYLLP